LTPHGPAGSLRLADARAARWGALVLAAVAIFYYGLYFTNGLNLGGEGGTTAVLAMRLMEGERPHLDTFLGYNVMWFWPVAWIFEITGPHYLVMRGYFFGLCTLTAILGFFCVRRVVGSGLYALAAGISLVLVPGMIFRNYMGLLPVAMGLALVAAFVYPPARTRNRRVLYAVAGAVLGLVFLVRIEVGYPCVVIWAVLLVVGIFAPGGTLVGRLKESALAGVLGLAGLVAIHAPFLADAHGRGYARDFYNQYQAIPGLLRWELEKAFARAVMEPAPAAITAAAKETARETAPAVAQTQPAPQAPAAGGIDGRRKRPAVWEIVTGERSRDRYFAAAVYLPVLVAGGLVLGAALAGLRGLVARDARDWREGLAVGVLAGCALTLFPQYFVFRPDTPHITEFMAPFQVALFCAAGLAVRRAVEARRPVPVVFAAAAGLALVVSEWVHFGHAWPKESAGTIAARKNGPEIFEGLNGVRVRLRADRADAYRGLQDAIAKNSRPGEKILVLPYSPTIHLMADRPAYLWDLYTDNTMAGRDFDETRIREIEKYRPPVVVIDHRDINDSEASRFPNWAPVLYAYLNEHYESAGRFLTNEVFVRRPDGG